jgi:uncharacterized protein YbjT (DUF2867 family)
MERKRIAVAGATGRVGRHVVELLQQAGHEAVPISRSHGIDVVTGDGLTDAVAGAEAIVDAATGPSPDEAEATAFFTAATRNLQAAGERAGVQRAVVVSIVGIDRFTGGYAAAKKTHEQLWRDGPIPARILRATQFHEFIEVLMQWGRRENGVLRLQEMRTQPVAARSVAEALVALALGDGGGPAIGEIGGPREESLVELAALLSARQGDGVRVEGFTDPDDHDAVEYASGGALPGPAATLTGPTFTDWLT